MALTTVTTRANVLLSEILADVPLKALTPKVVFWPLMNQDSTDGQPSLTKKYPKKSDLGVAAAATEGVDFTLSTTLAYDSSISATPTEAAVARADITTKAIRRAFPGKTAAEVYGRLAVGDFSGLVSLLQEEGADLARMCWEKIEKDCCALLDDASVSVGVSGSDFSVANGLLAIYSLEAGEPEHEDFAWIWHPQQTADMRTALLSVSAASSATWMTQADAGFLNFHPDIPRNGLKGTFLGIPIFQTSPSVNPLPNAGADVAGALACIGRGAPGQAGSQRGAHVFVEGHPMQFLFDFDPSGRAVELLCVDEYAVVEHTDAHYISIITDAP